jgi:hypothetical protein
MMEKRTVTHGKFSVTVSAATTLQGMRRTRLRSEAFSVEEDDPDRRILHRLIWPDMVAATIDCSGFNLIDFEEYLDLPEEFTAPWEEAIYDLNPHWRYRPDETEEKKQPMTSSGD